MGRLASHFGRGGSVSIRENKNEMIRLVEQVLKAVLYVSRSFEIFFVRYTYSELLKST